MSELLTIDGIVGALYHALSFAPGGQPDYERLADLFYPGARALPPNDDDLVGSTLSVDELIELSKEAARGPSGRREEGLIEREVARSTSAFGTIAQVFSTFEVISGDARARGVNALQLVYQGGRWWIASFAWDDESQLVAGDA